MPDYISALILGAIEGLAEFIPVSSTAHLIFLGHFVAAAMGFLAGGASRSAWPDCSLSVWR